MQSSFSLEKPNISKDLAINLAEKHFDLKSEILKAKEFDSYCDKNFYFKTKSGHEVVLKILNHVDSSVEGMVEAQNGAMLFLKNQGLDCTVPVEATSGSYIVYYGCSERVQGDERRDEESVKMNAVRLMRYVPGEILKNVAVLTENLLFDLGQYVGKMDKILKDYSHPGLNDQVFFDWDLQHISKIKPYISAKYLGSDDRENLIMNVYDKYFAIVPQVLEKCSKQVIHNDINESNIIVTQEETSDATDAKWSIAGVIDFGDVCYTYRVFEIAITMAQIITLNYCSGNPRPFESAGKVLKGYQSVYPLSTEELGIIYWCIAGRYIQLSTIGAFRSSFEPENEYIMDVDIHIWKVLPEYLKVDCKELLDKWMNDGADV